VPRCLAAPQRDGSGDCSDLVYETDGDHAHFGAVPQDARGLFDLPSAASEYAAQRTQKQT